MASNDMNSWDDDPDERLRQHWQQTFANFKVEAHSALGDRILNALPTGRRRRRVYRLTVLLVLVSIGLLYPLRIGEGLYSNNNATTVRCTIIPDHPLPDSRIHSSEASTSRSVFPRLLAKDSRLREPVVYKQPMLNSPMDAKMATSGVGVSLGSRTLRRPSSINPTQFLPGTVPNLRATAVPADQSRAASVRSVGTRLTVPLTGPAATDNLHEPVLAPVEQSVDYKSSALSTSHSSVVEPLANAVPVVWTRINPTGILLLSSQLSALPNQLPTIHAISLPPAEALVAHRRRQWFVEVVPLNTFQWMSVPPVATVYLSQVKAPAALSAATLGYQVNGGIRWQHWQAHLSLGQVRRWAYYTVNENRYRVVPRPDNPNHLVRETSTVAENVLLPMIGVGLSQETLLDRGRYAVDLGGQATYLPTSQQALIGLRGGIGRRLAVSRAIELQVGLRAEYGLNRLLSAQQQVAIHPLLVGIGLRIQPRSF